jgi:hypothetical protein
MTRRTLCNRPGIQHDDPVVFSESHGVQPWLTRFMPIGPQLPITKPRRKTPFRLKLGRVKSKGFRRPADEMQGNGR